MPDFPISDEALKAAAEAAHTQLTLYSLDRREWPEVIEAAIEAFLRAEGFEVERTAEWTKNNLKVPFHNDAGGPLGDGWQRGAQIARLVSPWKPEKAQGPP